MDGWSVLSVLKADPALAAIPIVMVTMVDDRPKAFALGADEYLIKPIGRDDISRVLGPLLGGSATVLAVAADGAERLAGSLPPPGWRILVAGDRAEALESLQTCRPAAVLVDMALPGRDAFRLLEDLRRDARFTTIPVVAVGPPAGRAGEGEAPRPPDDDMARWLGQLKGLLDTPGER
jgi:CheY-like chemotaxis protein